MSYCIIINSIDTPKKKKIGGVAHCDIRGFLNIYQYVLSA